MFVKVLLGYEIQRSVYWFGVDRCRAIYLLYWEYTDHNFLSHSLTLTSLFSGPILVFVTIVKILCGSIVFWNFLEGILQYDSCNVCCLVYVGLLEEDIWMQPNCPLPDFLDCWKFAMAFGIQEGLECSDFYLGISLARAIQYSFCSLITKN